MNPYVKNNGHFTKFVVRGITYSCRKRFKDDVGEGNILDVRHNGMYIGATGLDAPYDMVQEAKDFVGRLRGCSCECCIVRRGLGGKP